MKKFYSKLENIVKHITKHLAVASLVGILNYGNLVYGNKLHKDDIQVNTHTTSYQQRPDMAMDPNGNFVITWDSRYQDGYSLGVYAQRFDKDGNRIGNEFRVSTNESWQWNPRTVMDNDGNFVITYESGSHIFAQRFGKDGDRIGDEFRVSFTGSEQIDPLTAMDGQGNFLIAFRCDGGGGALAQRFDKDGTPIGDEFWIAGGYTYMGNDKRIAMYSNGDFIATGTTGDERKLYAYRYDKSGSLIKDILVSVSKDCGLDLEIGQSNVSLNSDSFIVTWKDYDNSGMGVYAQRFRTDGSECEDEFQVNTYTEKQQVQPDVAMDKEGKSVIVWVTGTKYDPSADVYVQRFDKDGKRIGNEFRVNSYTEGWQGNPRIAMNYCNSDLVITWCDGGGYDGDGYGIFAKKFSFYNPADLGKDGYVNFKDYAIWANSWLDYNPDPNNPSPGDINKDGKVDYGDLETLTENWLAYYP